MARYKVLRKSFINNAIAEEGDVVEFEGEAGDNLEAIEKPPAKEPPPPPPPAKPSKS